MCNTFYVVMGMTTNDAHGRHTKHNIYKIPYNYVVRYDKRRKKKNCQVLVD